MQSSPRNAYVSDPLKPCPSGDGDGLETGVGISSGSHEGVGSAHSIRSGSGSRTGKSNSSNVRGKKISYEEVAALYARPLMDLILEAQTVTRRHFEANTIQLSTLVSIKTGGCPEDCGYCPQAARYHTEVESQPMMALAEVISAAKAAQANGATRFCMGAAWRSPKDHQIESVAECVTAVKALGLETCVTLGMLKKGQAESLADAGLDYYNHNLDTSPSFYGQVISTRTYNDRLATLARVRDAGLKVCCGGIIGMGETAQDRVGLLVQLANLEPYPESVPINELVRVSGTPLSESEDLDPLEFVRTIAVARLLMPTAYVRLSAGRQTMSDSTQTLCFMAGANSIFYGEKLLTTDNPEWRADESLFERIGVRKHTALSTQTQPSTSEAL